LAFATTNEMQSLLKKNIMADAFDSVMAERKFEVYGSDLKVVELVPNGSNISITMANAKEFCTAFSNYKYKEFRTQCDAIRRGLATIVPVQMLSLFTWSELERLVVGGGCDVDLLQEMTQYEGCSKDDAHVKWFWEMMRKFTEKEFSLFLAFVWGRSRLPLSKESWGEQKFRLSNFAGRGRDDPDKCMPVSHTCFFHLELPRYTSLENMTEKITYAIVHCAVIDGDSNDRMETIQANIESDDDE